MIYAPPRTNRPPISNKQRYQKPISIYVAPLETWMNATLPRHFSASLKIKFDR